MNSAPKFGPREQMIYQYGLLDAARRKAHSEEIPRKQSPEDESEMRQIEAKLNMTHEDILKEDFVQMGV
jgi:hypothetical protein